MRWEFGFTPLEIMPPLLLAPLDAKLSNGVNRG